MYIYAYQLAWIKIFTGVVPLWKKTFESHSSWSCKKFWFWKTSEQRGTTIAMPRFFIVAIMGFETETQIFPWFHGFWRSVLCMPNGREKCHPLGPNVCSQITAKRQISARPEWNWISDCILRKIERRFGSKLYGKISLRQNIHKTTFLFKI